VGAQAVGCAHHREPPVGGALDHVLPEPNAGTALPVPPGEHWLVVVALDAQVGGHFALRQRVEPDQAPVRGEDHRPVLERALLRRKLAPRPSESPSMRPECRPLREPVTTILPSWPAGTPRKAICVCGEATPLPGVGNTLTGPDGPRAERYT